MSDCGHCEDGNDYRIPVVCRACNLPVCLDCAQRGGSRVCLTGMRLKYGTIASASNGVAEWVAQKLREVRDE